MSRKGDFLATQQAGGGGGTQIATGSYSGDGASPRTIPTGLAGPLRKVEVYERFPAEGADSLVKTDTMPGQIAWVIFGDTGPVVFPIHRSLDFTASIVGLDFRLEGVIGNAFGVDYDWVAFA